MAPSERERSSDRFRISERLCIRSVSQTADTMTTKSGISRASSKTGFGVAMNQSIMKLQRREGEKRLADRHRLSNPVGRRD